MIKFVFCGFLFLAIAFGTSAQQNHISWEYNYNHFGIKNGLPSSETYKVYQDKSGLLWILTDRGVVKYDGFDFYTYTTENGLADDINFKVEEDHEGGVWFIGFDGLLSVFRNGKMQPYQYNSILKKLVPEGKNVFVSIHINKDRSLVYSAVNTALVTVSDQGKVRKLLKGFDPKSAYLFEAEHEWMFYRAKAASSKGRAYFIRDKEKLSLGIREFNSLVRFKKHGNHHFFRSANKLFLFGYDKQKYFHEKEPVIGLDSDQEFLYVGLYKNGLKKYRFNPVTKTLSLVKHYLPDYSVSSVCKDKNGTLWISTLENGVFAICDEAFSQLAVNGSVLDQDFRFVNGNKEKVILTQYVGKWQQLYTPYLSKDVGKIMHDFMLCPFNNGFAFEKGIIDWSGWGDIHEIDNVNPVYTEGSSLFGRNYDDNLITQYKPSGSVKLSLLPIDDAGLKGGNIQLFYIASNKELFVLRGSSLYAVAIENGKLITNRKKLLSNQIKLLKYNQRWGLIAVSVTGDFFRVDLRKLVLNKLDLTIDAGKHVSVIFFDEQDQLWVASQKGVFLLVNREDEVVVRAFLNKKLLSSAEINDLYAYKNQLYLATKFGVQKVDVLRVKKTSRNCPLNLFSIKGFANNKEVQTNKVYPSNTDLIKIRLFNKNLDKQQTYRYRFGKDQTWIKSDKGEIIVNNPTDGDFTLEVSCLDAFDQWSVSKVLTVFTVEKVIFLRWYFILVYIGLIVLLFYVVLKYTVKAANRKNELLNRMMELERMALAAQMNPHFIFNSLNSIHSFLLYEENENAEKYLLRFAKLIRQTLTNSRASYITLADEYETLKNYMLLEKMRFKDAFDFEISCNFNELPLHPCIPPMLIQPYVENAILHGLGKRTSGGELKVAFYMEDEFLKVLITDNGIGYTESKKRKKDSNHKSYGTQITEERLKTLQKKETGEFFVQISDLGSDPEFPGTKVILTIPIPVN